MSYLSQGNHANVIIKPGDIYRVSTTGVATVQGIYGAPATTTTLTAQTQDFGPYEAPAKLKVSAVSSQASYSLLGFQGSVVTLTDDNVVSAGDIVLALTELASTVPMTATGAAFTGACEYAGLNIRAVTGTVNIVVYDAASATGNPIQTESAVTLGGKPWMGAGTNHRRVNGAGVWVVVSGGGTVEFDVLVG